MIQAYRIRLIIELLLLLILNIKCNSSEDLDPLSKKVVLNDVRTGTSRTYKRFYRQDGQLTGTYTWWMGHTYTTEVLYHGNTDTTLVGVIGFYLNQKFGNSYLFYPNGMLEQYSFFDGNCNCSKFTLRFSEDHKITFEEGSPFVFQNPILDPLTNHPDSLILLFSKAYYDSLSVDYSLDHRNYHHLDLQNSFLQPRIEECIIRYYDYPIYLKIYCHSSYGDMKNTYQDTVFTN